MITDKRRDRGLLYQQPLPAGYIEEPQPSASIAAGPSPLGPPVYPYGWGSGYNGSSTTGIPPMYGQVPANLWAVNNASPPSLKEPVTAQPAAAATPSASNPPAPGTRQSMTTTADAMVGNQGMSYVPQGNVGTAEVPRGLMGGGGGASSGGMNELAARDMANRISRENAPQYKQSDQITSLVDDIKSAAFFGQKKKGRILNALLESLVKTEAAKYGSQTQDFQTRVGGMGHAGSYLAGLGKAGMDTAPEWAKIGLAEQKLPAELKAMEAGAAKAYGEAGESEAKAGLFRRNIESGPRTFAETKEIETIKNPAHGAAAKTTADYWPDILKAHYPAGASTMEINRLAGAYGMPQIPLTEEEKMQEAARQKGLLK